jgi:hypothetical protein
MLEWCSGKWGGFTPDDSDMRKLIAQLRILFE